MLAATSNAADPPMTMDLLCHETETFKEHQHVERGQSMHFEPQVNTACADPTFLSERCLENLLKSEESNINLNFYNNPHCAITPKRRRIIAEWMMQVSTILWLLLIFATNCSQQQMRTNISALNLKLQDSAIAELFENKLDYAIACIRLTFCVEFCFFSAGLRRRIHTHTHRQRLSAIVTIHFQYRAARNGSCV